MKNILNWLIALYILTILTWSGLLKAETVQITNSSYDPNSMALTLEGVSSGACGLKVQSQLQNSNEVIVSIVADESQSICLPEESTRIFDFILDVRSFGLNPGSNYMIKVTNNNQISKATPSFNVEIPELTFYPQYNSVQSSGVLNITADGQWFLASANEKIIMLRTTLDLSRYLGQHVKVNGSEILHLTGPELTIDEHNPLRAIQSKKGPEVFVLSISAATY